MGVSENLATFIRVAPILAAFALAGAAGADEPSPEELLRRAGAYVQAYEQKLSALIAEETYEQRITRHEFDVRGFNDFVQKRVLRSDVLVVRRAGGGLPWLLFRDIFEVDGRAVRDRERRLERLFVEAGTADVQAIVDEGARYNLGPILRNYNVPTLVLAFLHPDLQASFRFEKAGAMPVVLDGRNLVRISFREVGRPTLIRGRPGSAGIPTRGTVWIQPRDGAVARTELRVEDLPGAEGLSAQLETRFQPVAAFGLWLPVEMRDRWQWPAASSFFEGEARYSNFRRPRVVIEETYTVPE